jgi:transposase
MTARKDSGKSSAGSRRRPDPAPALAPPGRCAKADGVTLQSYQVGALPLINRILERMDLERLLREYLPPDDPRCEIPTAHALLVLIRNLLMSREPIYGVGEWAGLFAPDLFDLWMDQIAMLHDDRLGRCLTRLFSTVGPEFILAVVRHVVVEFQVTLEELHNDSTTVSFYGAYSDAREEGRRLGRATHAITWGNSKARRPDLKQLLYTLTITDDGGIPVYFTTHSGNVVDDKTHIATWELLRQLVGGVDFLYVADCKLASADNLAHIARHHGRFVTVMPRTHGEDGAFRKQLRESPQSIRWQALYDIEDEGGEVIDRLSVCADEWLTSAGYRLLWYRSTRKVELDQVARANRIQRALAALVKLRERLLSPRTRFRERGKVEQAVEAVLSKYEVQSWVRVAVSEEAEAIYRQAQPGRPTDKTTYRRISRDRYRLTWELDAAALAEAEREDGIFPLLTNDRQLSAEEVLRAYKRQPVIEKRFSQLKTDFAVAPMHLQDIARIQGMLAAYFFVLLVQTLLERELRRAMAREGVESLPMYPEGRPCRRPTAHRIIEIFEPIQRHVLTRTSSERPDVDSDVQVMVTELTPVQHQIVELLGLSPETYGRQ